MSFFLLGTFFQCSHSYNALIMNPPFGFRYLGCQGALIQDNVTIRMDLTFRALTVRHFKPKFLPIHVECAKHMCSRARTNSCSKNKVTKQSWSILLSLSSYGSLCSHYREAISMLGLKWKPSKFSPTHCLLDT